MFLVTVPCLGEERERALTGLSLPLAQGHLRTYRPPLHVWIETNRGDMCERCRLQIEVTDDTIPIGLRGGGVGMRGGIDLLRHRNGGVIYANGQLMRTGCQPWCQLVALRRSDVVRASYLLPIHPYSSWLRPFHHQVDRASAPIGRNGYLLAIECPSLETIGSGEVGCLRMIVIEEALLPLIRCTRQEERVRANGGQLCRRDFHPCSV